MPPIVHLTSKIPDLIVDMRYASTRNIAGKPLSTEKAPRLQESAAIALGDVVKKLREQGFRLVIWDAYRPESTQEELQRMVSDRRYVLDHSNHCLGLAVDVTLADTNGSIIDMGTDHDDFTARAHADYARLTPVQLHNRQLLKETMEGGGHFMQWQYEWWHFDYIG